MSYHLNLKKLVNELRGPKGVAALSEEFDKISSELAKLKKQVKPKATAQLKKAEARYASLLKKLQTAQKDLDSEVSKRVSVVKKQAVAVEKDLANYKKLAMKQKTEWQKAFSKKAASAQKTVKKTSKKASKKASA